MKPYRGIGTGIRRAYDDWNLIDLTDDRDACTFTATVQRRPVPEELVKTTLTEVSLGGPIGGQKGGQKPLTKRQQQIHDLLRQDPILTRAQLAHSMGINSSAVQKHIDALKQKGVIKRVGGAKGGYWQVIDDQ